MEWVETTGRTIDDARDAALDRLGVGVDEAEIEIVEEPKVGLFGRTRGEARLRARVKPTPARAKQDRRRGSRGGKRRGDEPKATSSGADRADRAEGGSSAASTLSTSSTDDQRGRSDGTGNARRSAPEPESTDGAPPEQSKQHRRQQERTMSHDDETNEVTPQEVGDAAVAFMDGLTSAFGADATSALSIDGTELDVSVTGSDLGLLVGSGGRTLNAIQDLARVAAQRRLGDHDTRLRVDIAGYRERRQEALARFARDVAGQVRESGSPRSMEPMSSADRKVIHDVLNEEQGVASRSEGEDPNRRIVVVPVE